MIPPNTGSVYGVKGVRDHKEYSDGHTYYVAGTVRELRALIALYHQHRITGVPEYVTWEEALWDLLVWLVAVAAMVEARAVRTEAKLLEAA